MPREHRHSVLETLQLRGNRLRIVRVDLDRADVGIRPGDRGDDPVAPSVEMRVGVEPTRGGRWCLAHCGIARYDEAATAPDTRKMAMSEPYAAQERWRFERATSAADVYSIGIMAWHMLMGDLPFTGPGWTEFREQHRHEKAPDLTGVPAAIASLVDECLFKPPEARPTPKNLLARPEGANTPRTPAPARLHKAQHQTVADQSNALASDSADLD